ncbi:MAG: hypothetical protein M3044_09825 [Thermoproteota archaeon]|nr:hypothetical protein [Thermoproteota archaeon]
MEELDFFEEICLTSLYTTKAVKFAAVVDSNAKLMIINLGEATDVNVLRKWVTILKGQEEVTPFIKLT